MDVKKQKYQKKCSIPVRRKSLNEVRPVILNLDAKPWVVFYNLCAKNDCPYTHIGLISGCGGIDLGLRMAGFMDVFADYFRLSATETHNHNIGDILGGDVRKVTFSKMDQLDLLNSRFPCKSFSNAGFRKGISDRNRQVARYSPVGSHSSLFSYVV